MRKTGSVFNTGLCSADVIHRIVYGVRTDDCVSMCVVYVVMFIAEVNSSRTNLSPFTKGYRGLASRMQLVSNLLKGFLHGDPPPLLFALRFVNLHLNSVP